MTTTISDVKIGDEIYFRRDGIDNFDLFWIVKHISGNWLTLAVDDNGCKGETTIDFKYVTHINSARVKS